MNKLFILIVLSLLFCNFSAAQSLRDELEKVKEIKLLESNQDDVRKIFAGYKSDIVRDLAHYDKFYTQDSEIRISYSGGKCKDKKFGGFNVSEWKVTEIEISPYFSTTLKKVGFNLAKYKRERMYSNTNSFYVYHNKNLGIIFEVNENRVMSISLNPPKKYYSSLLSGLKIANKN